MKKTIAAIIAAAMIAGGSLSVFAMGGSSGIKYNDDGSTYSMSCYLAYYLNNTLGTNYAESDNFGYWRFETLGDITADIYKEVNFENFENHEKNDSYLFDVVAISKWSDLPELRCANIENNIEYIEDSFNNCPKLLNVFVPKSVKKIVNSFNNSNCTIYGVPGSYAESYAKQNGIPFANGVEVTINKVGVAFDQPAFVKDNRTVVPMRKIFEKLGATVNWDANTQTITATKGSTTISLQIGSNILKKNNSEIELDVPAFAQNDRTLVPLRAISESLGAEVNWDGDTQTASITQ